MLNNITPVILTYNEEPNIARTLDALTWAKRVVVMDSFSDDRTQAICDTYANVDFVQRKFDVLAKQWKAAISQTIDTDWVLALDADYICTQELIDEIADLNPSSDTAGYRTSFVYLIDGNRLRGTLYPPVITLYRRQGADYKQDGHAQRVLLSGVIEDLTNPMLHDDRKSEARWHQSQKNYARQEADKFRRLAFKQLPWTDKIRYLGLGPLLVIPYTLFVRGLIWDGLPGLKYTWQRATAESYLLAARFKNIKESHHV